MKCKESFAPDCHTEKAARDSAEPLNNINARQTAGLTRHETPTLSEKPGECHPEQSRKMLNSMIRL
jgi:hypothetical protein